MQRNIVIWRRFSTKGGKFSPLEKNSLLNLKEKIAAIKSLKFNCFFLPVVKKVVNFARAKNALENTNYLRAYLVTGKKWTKFATFFKIYLKEIFAAHWKNLIFNFKLYITPMLTRFLKGIWKGIPVF